MEAKTISVRTQLIIRDNHKWEHTQNNSLTRDAELSSTPRKKGVGIHP